MNEVLQKNAENGIFYVPKIRAIRIKNIGLWRHASLEFIDGVNIITGMTASGKSTILKCILAGISGNEALLKDLIEHKNSRIEIELIAETLDLKTGNNFAAKSVNACSIGESLYNKLLDFTNKTNKGYALLVDGIMDRFSKNMFKKALSLFQKTKNQKIIITKRYEEIANARIFECVCDNKTHSSEILVRDA